MWVYQPPSRKGPMAKSNWLAQNEYNSVCMCVCVYTNFFVVVVLVFLFY